MKFNLIILINSLALASCFAQQDLQIQQRGVGDDLKFFLEEFRKRMCYDIPKIGTPALDPYQLDELKYSVNSNFGIIDLKIQNLQSNGLSDFVIHKLNLQILGMKLDSNISIPKIEFKGKYKLNGTINGLLDLNGEGDLSIIAENVGFALAAKTPVTAGGTLRMNITQLDPFIEKMTFRIENLFPDDELNEFINDLMNDLGIELGTDLFIQSKAKVIEVSEKIGNGILSGLTLKDLLKIILNIRNIFDENDPKPDCKEEKFSKGYF